MISPISVSKIDRRRFAHYSLSYLDSWSHLFKKTRAIGQRKCPPVLMNAIPKAGTHLGEQFLKCSTFYRHSGRRTLGARHMGKYRSFIDSLDSGQYRTAHLGYDAELADYINKKNIVHFLIVRNPVDIVISRARYLREIDHSHPSHIHFRGVDCPSAVDLSIHGAGNYLPPIWEVFRSFHGWNQMKNGPVIVRFEDWIKEISAAHECNVEYPVSAKLASLLFENDLKISVEGIVLDTKRSSSLTKTKHSDHDTYIVSEAQESEIYKKISDCNFGYSPRQK